MAAPLEDQDVIDALWIKIITLGLLDVMSSTSFNYKWHTKQSKH